MFKVIKRTFCISILFIALSACSSTSKENKASNTIQPTSIEVQNNSPLNSVQPTNQPTIQTPPTQQKQLTTSTTTLLKPSRLIAQSEKIAEWKKLEVTKTLFELLKSQEKEGVYSGQKETSQSVKYSIHFPEDWKDDGSDLLFSNKKKAASGPTVFIVNPDIKSSIDNYTAPTDYTIDEFVKSKGRYKINGFEGTKVISTDVSLGEDGEKEYYIYSYCLYNVDKGFSIDFLSLNGKPEAENEKLFDKIVSTFSLK